MVGGHLGRHARADLAERVRLGRVPAKENRRADRKRELTQMSSSRWAGAMTRLSEDQYQLSLRCLFDERTSLRRVIAKISKRLTVPCGQRVSGVLAHQHGCTGFAIEDLGFSDARATGRETMGRGKRGKAFRHTVSGLPTARFPDRLAGMAHHAGLVVIAVDPAHTSRWGTQHWKAPLQQQSKTTTVTGHHAAAAAIGRRALGHGIRRRPGVTAHDRRIVARRATGQAVTVPRARGTASPPRTTGTPHPGDKTCRDRSDKLALFPVSQDRSGRQPARPVYGDIGDRGRHRQER